MAGNGIPSAADVIVVGSGSAGAVVARRLVDAGAQVVLLEAGDAGPEPGHPRPGAAVRAVGQRAGLGLPDGAAGRLRGPRAALAARQGARRVERAQRDDLRARPSQRLRHVGVPRQRGLGLRRRAAAVQALGGLRPRRVRPTTARAGRCTCCRATSRTRPSPRVAEAAQEAGVPFNDDHNGEHLEGVAFCQLTIKDGVRHSTAVAFLAPVADAPNLTVLTGAHAQRLLFEGERCVGVELVRDGEIARIRAEGEVIVCGGTVESPKLLLLSGIGAADELAAARDRRRRRPARRRAQPARSPALAGHPRGLAAGAAAAARPPAAPQPSLRAQPAGPARAGHPAALLPPAALPRGHGGPARRLHADGRRHPPREPRDAPPRLGRPVRAAADRPGLPRLRRRRRRARRRDRAVPRDRRPGRARRLARPRALSGAGRADAQGAARLRPRHRDHLPPPGRHLQDGRRRPGGRRPAAARARGGGAARRRRLGDAVRQLGQHARADGHDRRAGRRSRARGARKRAPRPRRSNRCAGRA